MPLKWQEKPLPKLAPGERHSLFAITLKFFPTTFLIKAIGVSFTSFLFIYRYLVLQGIGTLVTRVLLTAAVVAGAPTIILYLFTLARAPRLRRHEEREAAHRQNIEHNNLQALQMKERKEEQEIVRLEEEASGNLKAREVKDKQEDKRWDLLNESLRLQKETVELASEERLLVAQQVKESKEEGDVMRKGLVSDDLEARHIKESREERRWAALEERLRQLELRNEEREQRQLRREQEQERLRLEHRLESDLKDQYRTLFDRFVRNASQSQADQDVANGIAPLPLEWLSKQPELRKNPDLAKLLEPYNAR